MPTFLVTVDAGLEPVTRDEILERRPTAVVETHAFGVAGRLRVEDIDAAVLLELRTAHHVDELRAAGPVDSPAQVRAVVADARIDELAGAASFRVSSRIRGEPGGLDRIDLQRAAGAVLCERYETAVDLRGFEIEIRADLLGGTLVVGPRLDRRPLADRVQRGRAVRSSLKATTAAALLRLVGAHRGDGALIDPMCGAGTIPLEAWRANPRLTVHATDWDAPTVEVANGTFRNHDVPLHAEPADARTLGDRCPAAFDWIVTDPPYGMRQGRRSSLGDLYRRVLASFARAIRPEGTIGVVAVKHRLFAAAVADSGLHVHDRVGVDAGTVRLWLFVLRPGGERPSIEPRRRVTHEPGRPR